MNDHEKKRLIELDDVKHVLSTEQGRRFVNRMIVRAGVYKTSYSPDSTSEHVAFKEGGRNTGLFLMAECQEAAQASFMKMIEESYNES